MSRVTREVEIVTTYLVTHRERVEFTGENAADAEYAAADYMYNNRPELTEAVLLDEATTVRVAERKMGTLRTVPNKPEWR